VLEQWILDQVSPLSPASPVILRDPQRVIRKGAWVVDGWAEANGYSVFFCVGNLGLREMVEAVRDDADARVLLVDRSREDAKTPLFYPDLAAHASPRHTLSLSLRDFLIRQTGDPRWPHLADSRSISRLILANLEGTLQAHRQLREVDPARFTDTDLRKLVLGAALKINPFRKLAPAEIRRVCVEEHQALDQLNDTLPDDVMGALKRTLSDAPVPFRYLLERDAKWVIRAFTLAALMHQHGLEYQILLPNLDPQLHDYRDIDPEFLEAAMQNQMSADPERVVEDVRDAERFLVEEPGRLAFLMHERLRLDEPERARAVLVHERLSVLLRSLALASLLVDLIGHPGKLTFHEGTLAMLAQQSHQRDWPALRRPTEEWETLHRTYSRAIDLCRLLKTLAKVAKQLTVASGDQLDFTTFDQLWNRDRLNRLDFYVSDLERTVRVGAVAPIPQKAFWPDLSKRWEQSRAELNGIVRTVEEVQSLIDARFQDLYHAHYADWIRQDDAPMVFTHQFLDRVLKPHWDPQSGRKAVVMVFDGLRVDAWEELLRPVLEERFEVVKQYPGSALIPTETHLSRKAIAAGCLPEAFTATSELSLLVSWLKSWMGSKAPYFDVVKDQDTEASGMTVRYVSEFFEYIVFNFTDANLHHNSQDLAFIYTTMVREIIRQDVRSVLRELPDDAVVFVTSDHGFVPMPNATVTVPDSLVGDATDVTYLHARTRGQLADERVIAFDARKMGIPTVSGAVSYDTVLFPRPGYYLQRQRHHRRPDRYSHGGVSLAECMVPMAVLGPKATDVPLLAIAKLQQVGSVSEGDDLSLEVVVEAIDVSLSEMTVTLAFTPEELPMRREVFSGQRDQYLVTWTPRLGDITEEDRKAQEKRLPVTVVLSYADKGKTYRTSASIDLVVKLVPGKLRRRVDSKLDFLMGKVPKGLQS